MICRGVGAGNVIFAKPFIDTPTVTASPRANSETQKLIVTTTGPYTLGVAITVFYWAGDWFPAAENASYEAIGRWK